MILRLVVIEVAVARGCHDHVVPLLRSRQAPFHPSPAHDRGRFVHVALHQFIPAYQLSPVAVQEGLHPLGEIALQPGLRLLIAVSLQPQFLDALLTSLALLPPHLRSLVAPNMDILRGEYFHQFRQHTLHELKSLLLSRTKDVIKHPPMALHLVGTARASQFRIGFQCPKHVSRHVNFRNHRDIPLLRIAHDLLQFLLRVAAAVGRAVVNRRITPQHRIATHRALLHQLQVTVDGYTPSLIVRQVPMETVHIVHRHRVEILLHKRHTEEMASHVKMHAPIAKPRSILYHRSRKNGLTLQTRNRLAQRLYAIEHPLRRQPLYRHSLPVHADAVALRLRHLLVQSQHNGLFLRSLLPDGNIHQHLLPQILPKELGIPRQPPVFSHDYHLLIQHEALPLLHHNLSRQRHHLVFRRQVSLIHGNSHTRQYKGQTDKKHYNPLHSVHLITI